jgi:multiple sugar transport system ATP-binding protein
MLLPMTSVQTIPALQLRGLSKSFRGTPAVDGVSFAVPQGSLTVLLGPAGAGKTTTLRLIAGLDRQDSGDILLHGTSAGRREPKDRDVAMIFDNLALYPDKTGFENLAYPLALRGLSKADIESQVNKTAGLLQIAHVLRRLPKTMSGGERQRVALGRALVRKPGLFLLDEPLASLDAVLRVELRAELKRLQREFGFAFLLATPDYAEAMAIADTVVMLRKGTVVQIAEPQTIYDFPVDREVARFVGAPEINLVPARFEQAEGGKICAAGASLSIPLKLQFAPHGHGGHFELGIRPEHLKLADPLSATIRAQVVDVEPLGLKSTLTVKNPECELRLVIDAPSARKISAGETVGIEPVTTGLLAFDPVSGRRIDAVMRGAE